MMFLECKGGNINFNATEKKWYQNNKVLNKDPITQATDGKYKLLKILSKAFLRF